MVIVCMHDSECSQLSMTDQVRVMIRLAQSGPGWLTTSLYDTDHPVQSPVHTAAPVWLGSVDSAQSMLTSSGQSMPGNVSHTSGTRSPSQSAYVYGRPMSSRISISVPNSITSV